MKKKFVTRKQDAGESPPTEQASRQTVQAIGTGDHPNISSDPFPGHPAEQSVFSSIRATGKESFVSDGTRKRQDVLASRGAEDAEKVAVPGVTHHLRQQRGAAPNATSIGNLPLDSYLRKINTKLPEYNIEFKVSAEQGMVGPISSVLHKNETVFCKKKGWSCRKLDEVIGLKKLTGHTPLLSITIKPRVIKL